MISKFLVSLRKKRFFVGALTLFILPFLALLFYASSEGPFSPVRVVESDYGGIDWDHRNDCKTSDNRHAEADLDDSEVSDYLEITKFGFAIPIGATIDGIEVSIERKGEDGGIKDDVVKLIKGGVISGTNKATDFSWPVADEAAAYGGSADLWGLAFTEADINSDDFGVAIAVKRSTSTGSKKMASIDHFQITVYYTSPLPVELLNFTADSKEKEVELKWTTASEKNNDFYSVERSENGISFNTLAKMDGAGNTSTKRDYVWRDSDPLEGTSYYRLVQTDFDGTAVTYNPVAVNRTVRSNSPCTFRVYPNPCPGNCNVTLEDCPEGKEKEITLAVFDALGNKVLTNVLMRDEKGSFNFSIDTKNNLMPGVYIVQASTESEKYSNKVIMKNQ